MEKSYDKTNVLMCFAADPCDPNPCHGGTCYKSEDGGPATVPFICICPAFGTVGDFCDSGKMSVQSNSNVILFCF